MKKVGIIRCQQTEDVCPGTTDFNVASMGKEGFHKTGPVEIMGFVSCGGCPGKKAVFRARQMVERGAEIIALTSCISKGSPIGFPCPHFEKIMNSLREKLPQNIEIIDYTH